MARWRAEALKRLPELRELIENSDNVMALWSVLYARFEAAYRMDPPDDALIGRIYSFADWCVAAPRDDHAGRDPLTAVVVSFYEDVPAFAPAREDMPRWFKYAEVAENRAVFATGIGDAAFNELLRTMARQQHRYQPRRRCHG